MNIEIPAIPAGIILLLGFFAPYAIGPINGALAAVQKPWQKKLVSIAFSIALAVLVVVIYLGMGGSLEGYNWGTLIVLAVLVVAASYALVTKPTASALEDRVDNALH